MENKLIIIEKWKNYFQKDILMIHELQKLKGSEEIDDFFSKMQVFDEFIYSKIGAGYNKLNELTIKNIAYNFVQLLKDSSANLKDIFILLGHNGMEESKIFVQQMSYVFLENKINIHLYDKNTPVNFSIFQKHVKSLNFTAAVFVGLSPDQKDYRKISFLKSTGDPVDVPILQKLILFEPSKIFSIKKQIQKPFYLDYNTLIKKYFDNLIKLKSRETDAKLLKVGLIDSSPSSTVLIKKILGNLNIEYKSFKWKNQSLTQKIFNINRSYNFSYFENKIVKKYNFDILIKPSNDGETVQFLGTNDGTIFEIDFELINLIFINYELEKLKQTNIDVGSKTIITDYKLSTRILNLVRKFKVSYLQEDLFKMNLKKYKKLDYIYFSHANHFLYDKNISNIPDIFQVILKIIEIMNYYKTQRKDFGALQKSMDLMYGTTEIYRNEISFREETVHEKLVELKEILVKKNEIATFNLINISETGRFYFKVAEITFKNNDVCIILYNRIKKRIIILADENNDSNYSIGAFIYRQLKLLKK